jgi:hypothetical protein
MNIRKLLMGLASGVVALSCGCHHATTTQYRPVVVGTAPCPAPAPCCNQPGCGAPAVVAPVPPGAQIPPTLPPGSVGATGPYRAPAALVGP